MPRPSTSCRLLWGALDVGGATIAAIVVACFASSAQVNILIALAIAILAYVGGRLREVHIGHASDKQVFDHWQRHVSTMAKRTRTGTTSVQ